MGKGMPGTPKNAPLTPQLVLDGLNIFAKKFFKETTKTYKAVGIKDPPDCELLVAVNILKKQTYLFKLSLNKVLWVTPPNHKVIGCGDLIIYPMLWDFDFVPQKETALFCGIRMMYHAKNIVEGVSGFTDAVALLNGGEMLFYGTSNTSRIESLVVNFEQYVDNSSTHPFQMYRRNSKRSTRTRRNRSNSFPASSRDIATNTKRCSTTRSSSPLR